MTFLMALVAGVAANPVPALAAPAAPTMTITDPYEGQTVPFPGQAVTLSGALGVAAARSVTLQYYSSSWKTYATATTDAGGNYTFQASTTSSSRRFRVNAPASGALVALTTDEVVVTTQKDTVTISVLRLGANLRVTGSALPIVKDRSFALQRKSGSSWVAVATTTETDSGALKIEIPAAGSQSYRWVGAPVLSKLNNQLSSGVTSSTYAFTASPATLGKNVIYVTTDSGSTPSTKGKDYTGSAVLVSGDNATESLRLETIAVRGNSSATKAKKPYKLKFIDKQKPFGMKSDRTWILLGNYQDWSLIRSRIAFGLGRSQNGLKWTPNEVFAELYINGKYLGSYEMVQSIKIDNNRVNVSKDTGQVMEHDPHWVDDETEGFVGTSGMNYEFKDPDDLVKTGGTSEDLTPERIAKMTTKIRQFESILYTKDWSKITLDASNNPLYNGAPLAAAEDWMTYLDLNSAVDYILTREFTKDNDADFYRSNFFYTNNVLPFFNGSNTTYKYSYPTGDTSSDKFFMGPIWDFDRSAGSHPTSSTGIQLPTGWWTNGSGSKNHDTNKIHWFTRIWKDVRFVNAVKARWAAHWADYRAVACGAGADCAGSKVDEAVADLGLVVAVNDRVKWSGSGGRYAAKASSSATESGYLKEVAWLKDWYKKRFNWMDEQLGGKAHQIP